MLVCSDEACPVASAVLSRVPSNMKGYCISAIGSVFDSPFYVSNVTGFARVIILAADVVINHWSTAYWILAIN